MKKISVVIPSYNEENSVIEMYERIKKLFDNELKKYEFEIVYVDDYSTDKTRELIEQVCCKDKNVKAVFNAKNFGFTRNCVAALKYSSGDGTFFLFGDLQDPPEVLIDFVEKWEQGYKVIVGQKLSSKESKVMYFFRSIYYRMIGRLSAIEQIQHFNGFGFYDKEFIDIIKELDDPTPYFRGIVSELGMHQTSIVYTQEQSKRGFSGETFFKNYDIAMTGITSYTKGLLRMATFVGAVVGILSILFTVYTLINKILYWDTYPVGSASILIGVFFLGAVQLFFIGILGEYILSINTRMMKRPLVVVEKKINFEDK